VDGVASRRAFSLRPHRRMSGVRPCQTDDNQAGVFIPRQGSRVPPSSVRPIPRSHQELHPGCSQPAHPRRAMNMTALIFQLIGGAFGGYAAGFLKDVNLGTVGAAVCRRHRRRHRWAVAVCHSWTERHGTGRVGPGNRWYQRRACRAPRRISEIKDGALVGTAPMRVGQHRWRRRPIN